MQIGTRCCVNRAPQAGSYGKPVCTMIAWPLRGSIQRFDALQRLSPWSFCAAIRAPLAGEQDFLGVQPGQGGDTEFPDANYRSAATDNVA